jgi:hypothetical protein
VLSLCPHATLQRPEGCQLYSDAPTVIQFNPNDPTNCVEIGSNGKGGCASDSDCGVSGKQTQYGVDLTWSYNYGCDYIFKLSLVADITGRSNKPPPAITQGPECNYRGEKDWLVLKQQCTFPIDLNPDLKYDGLDPDNDATTADDCRQNCCNDPTCDMYQYSDDPEPTCRRGAEADAGDGEASTTTWTGGMGKSVFPPRKPVPGAESAHAVLDTSGPDGVIGFVTFRESEAPRFGYIDVAVQLAYKDPNHTITSGHMWHIHKNMYPNIDDCSTAGPHYDPDGREASKDYHCEGDVEQSSCSAGDLSGKFGDITIDGVYRPVATVPSEFFEDSELFRLGISSIRGRSVVVHDVARKTQRIACGVIDPDEPTELYDCQTAPQNVSMAGQWCNIMTREGICAKRVGRSFAECAHIGGTSGTCSVPPPPPPPVVTYNCKQDDSGNGICDLTYDGGTYGSRVSCQSSCKSNSSKPSKPTSWRCKNPSTSQCLEQASGPYHSEFACASDCYKAPPTPPVPPTPPPNTDSCDLTKCQCDGVDLAGLRNERFETPEDNDGYRYMITLCGEIPKPWPTVCTRSADPEDQWTPEHPAVLRYKPGEDCDEVGSVGPCQDNDDCGMQGVRTPGGGINITWSCECASCLLWRPHPHPSVLQPAPPVWADHACPAPQTKKTLTMKRSSNSD